MESVLEVLDVPKDVVEGSYNYRPTMGGCIGTNEGTTVVVVSVKYKGSIPKICSRNGREYVSTAVPFCITTSLC